MGSNTSAGHRNSDDSSALETTLQKHEFAPSSGFVLSRHGFWLKKNWMDATFNFYYRGTYTTLLEDYLAARTQTFAFIDIGANQGLYSLLAARSDYCHRVLAFEPVQRTFSFLEENIQANPHADKISLFRSAVSDQDGTQSISIKPGHSGAATLRANHSRILRGAESISTVGPKSLATLKQDHPEIIKIDVEGHEKVVMTSLADAGYLDTATAVYYEVDTRWSEADQLRNILERHGFRHFAQSSAGKHYDVLATR